MRWMVITALCFAACSSLQAAVKTLPMQGEVFTVQDRTAFLILPKQFKSDEPTPWIWYAPTLKGLPGKEERWMFEQFLDHGMAIAGVDVGESYGSPAGRAVYTSLYQELVGKRGLAKKACLLARSRGGLMLYNWAAEHPESVACIAGIYPVCNLMSYPGLDRACSAYRMTEAELAAQIAEHNPVDRLAPLAKARVPIFHIHGDTDTVVPLDKNSALVKARYDKLGGHMTLEVVKGQGHNMWSGWFHSQDLVDFVIANSREGHADPLSSTSVTDLRCEYLANLEKRALFVTYDVSGQLQRKPGPVPCSWWSLACMILPVHPCQSSSDIIKTKFGN
ncbi:MAG: prolyl oligopeptidase family serine peptidase [Phycisphaerae bacterium]|nr:prolyl oligopeptidase family serine peptidase [Phycisphaerae bacterium]